MVRDFEAKNSLLHFYVFGMMFCTCLSFKMGLKENNSVLLIVLNSSSAFLYSAREVWLMTLFTEKY